MLQRIIIILFYVLPMCTLAQDDDYYRPDEEVVEEAEDLYRWGPRLGLEVHAAINYNHLRVPLALTGSFQKAIGGVGFDGGGGIRIRAYHKLAFSIGANYMTRSFNLKYEAQDELGNFFLVSESATMNYLGFYFKGIFTLSKNFHIAQIFQYGWLRNYSGIAIAESLSGTSVIYGPQETTEPVIDEWWAAGQAELGFEFAYLIHIAPELIIKPYGGFSIGLTPALHTKIYSQGFFGEKEQNLSYVNIRLGVIIETGIILDQFKAR